MTTRPTAARLLEGPKTLCHTKAAGARPAMTGKVMAEASGLMRGKRGLIMGVANNRSIAWGIARACRDHGAELAFTYQGDALKKRVEPLAEEVGGLVVGHCDVTEPATIDAVFAAVKRPGARSISSCTPSPFPTRTSSTAATSTPRRTISPRPC